MTQVRGSWLPAATALMRVLRAQVAARGDDPAFTDSSGTLTRAELWRLVRPRQWRSVRSGRGTLVVTSDEPRTVVVEALHGWLAGRTVVVVPPRAGERALRAANALAPGRPGIFFTTTGTTGTPKVVRSRRGLRAAGQMSGILGRLPRLHKPVVASLASVSTGHGFSTFVSTMALGGHFDALEDRPVEELMRLPHVDVLTGVPLQLRELAGAVDGSPPTNIRVVLSGSDRLVDAEFIGMALGGDVADAYGSTETGTVTMATPADRRRSPSTVGRPLPGVRIREQNGRLVISSPVLGRGTFAADLGFIRDGLVHVTGRADGVVVSGGENTSPEALREWLLRRPGVSAVAFDGVPDSRFGSRAVVRVTSSEPLDPDALRDEIRREFGPAAVPVRIDVVRG